MGRKRVQEETDPEKVIKRCDSEIRRLKEKRKEAIAKAELVKYKKLDGLIVLMEERFEKIDDMAVAVVMELVSQYNDDHNNSDLNI